MPFDAILLLAFGGPENMDEVRPFLANVLRGRPVPPQRLEAVVAHYALFNGRSPLKAITLRQADALHTALADDGLDLPVYVGMRNWHPYIHDTLSRMAADGVGRALGVIMSAQHSEAGWQRYQHDVAAAQERFGGQALSVTYLPLYPRTGARSRRSFLPPTACPARCQAPPNMWPKLKPALAWSPTGWAMRPGVWPTRAAVAIRARRGWSRRSAR